MENDRVIGKHDGVCEHLMPSKYVLDWQTTGSYCHNSRSLGETIFICFNAHQRDFQGSKPVCGCRLLLQSVCTLYGSYPRNDPLNLYARAVLSAVAVIICVSTAFIRPWFPPPPPPALDKEFFCVCKYGKLTRCMRCRTAVQATSLVSEVGGLGLLQYWSSVACPHT